MHTRGKEYKNYKQLITVQVQCKQ